MQDGARSLSIALGCLMLKHTSDVGETERGVSLSRNVKEQSLFRTQLPVSWFLCHRLPSHLARQDASVPEALLGLPRPGHASRPLGCLDAALGVATPLLSGSAQGQLLGDTV